MSKTLADHIASEAPLTLSRKHLKWIDGQIVESQGIMRVVPVKISTNKVFLDFHVFDIPEGEEFILIKRPIEPLVNPIGDRATLEVKVGKEKILGSLVRSCNTIAEARQEQDPLEEAVNINQEGQTQPILEEDVTKQTQTARVSSTKKRNRNCRCLTAKPTTGIPVGRDLPRSEM